VSGGSFTFWHHFQGQISYNLLSHLLSDGLGECKWSKFLLLTVKTVQVSFIHIAKCKDGFEAEVGKFSKCKVFVDFTPP